MAWVRPLIMVLLISVFSPSRALHVYDGVFTQRALSSLHRVGEDLVTAGWTGSVFDRESRDAANALEEAVLSLLEQCGDDCRFVEYWWREHYQPMEVHRDIDEAMCQATSGMQRCPRFGHVLYVRIDDDELRAPTMVWQEEAAPATGCDGGSDGGSDISRGGAPRRTTSLTVVPAVAGRLLRFDGAALHSVPPPLASASGGERRAVLLFNSWDVAPIDPDPDEPPPSDPEPASGDGGGEAGGEAIHHRPHACTPREQWTADRIVERPLSGKAGRVELDSPLLGDPVRRGCEANVLHSVASADDLRQALHSAHSVHRLALA